MSWAVVQGFAFLEDRNKKTVKSIENVHIEDELTVHPHLSDKRSVAPRLLSGGVPVFIDAEHKTAHNKVTVTDGRWVVTGSYNYNKNAESRNAENLLILDSPALAGLYEENWMRHRAHSSAFAGRPAGSAASPEQK